MSAFTETDDQRLLKAIAYITIVDDYCKQIVRESNIMKELGYDINNHNDIELTRIIKNKFYSTKNNLFLKLGHVKTPNSNSYVDICGTEYSNSLLNTINGHRVPVSFNSNRVIKMFETHENDMKNIGGRNFKEWDMTTLKTIFMFWHYKDDRTNKLQLSDFRSSAVRFGETYTFPDGPAPSHVYDNVMFEIKNPSGIINCDLSDKSVADIDKFNAIIKFAREKTNGKFKNIKRISNRDFVSIFLYVRNHIIHVGEGKRGFSDEEIDDIENVVRVFLTLTPIIDESILARFEKTTTMAIVDENDILEYKKFLKNLETNTPEARLTDWKSYLEGRFIRQQAPATRAQDSTGNNGESGPDLLNGFEIEVSRTKSSSYGLEMYPPRGGVPLTIPRFLTVRVGSRGIGGFGNGLKPIGSNFGEDDDDDDKNDDDNEENEVKLASLAVEEPYMLPFSLRNKPKENTEAFILRQKIDPKNNNWSFDLFYDEMTDMFLQVNLAEGTEEYYDNILKVIEDIEKDNNSSKKEKEAFTNRGRSLLVRLRHIVDEDTPNERIIETTLVTKKYYERALSQGLQIQKTWKESRKGNDQKTKVVDVISTLSPGPVLFAKYILVGTHKFSLKASSKIASSTLGVQNMKLSKSGGGSNSTP